MAHTPRKRTSKKNLSFALRELLVEGNVGTHEEICAALHKEGYEVNQPKISRLLHRLGAVKVVNAEGQNIYRLPHEQGLMHELNPPKVKHLAKQLVLDIVSNHALIVIHTTPGAAAIVAREIDLHRLKLGILGTIAGDDTIFIAPKHLKNIHAVLEGIKAIIEA